MKIQNPTRLLRLILAMLIPLMAFGLQSIFWAAIKPFAWFLFFPAVFFSSWIGGLSGGIIATVISTGLAWWFFIPPERSFALEDPFTLGSIFLFMGMGVLFGYSHERIKQANLKAAEALAAERSANDQLQSANEKITQLYEQTRELDQLKTQLFANVSHELRTRPGPAPLLAASHSVNAPLVLVVEDNPEMNAFLAEALGHHYQVVTAFDGQEGLRKALETNPDLILSDVMMPGVTGDQMVEELRCHPELDDVPIVLLTAKADDELRVKLLKGGVQDYLYKPFSVEELLARAGRLISERKLKEAERKQAQMAVQASQDRYRSTLDDMLEGAQIIGFDWRYLYLNDSAALSSRQAKEELLGHTITEQYPGFEKTEMFAALQQCMEERTARFAEFEFTYPDGAQGWFETSIQPVPEGIFILSLDITERKRAEDHIRKLNRIYAILSDINQAIVRIRDPQALFEEACQIAVAKGNFQLAWIGLVDDATQRIKVAASAGKSNGYFEKVDTCLTEETISNCPVHGALRQGQHVVCNMIGGQENLAACQKMALELGYRSSASFPLKDSGAIRGAFTLFADTPGFFDDDELKLLDELAMDISFAIEFAEQEEKRERAEEALRQSEQKFSIVFEKAAFAATLSSLPDGVILDVNEAWVKMSGYTRLEMVGKTTLELNINPDIEARSRIIAALKEYGMVRNQEMTLRIKTGELRILSVNVDLVDIGDQKYILNTAQDITERKKVEAALRESTEALQTMLDTSPLAFIVTDIQGFVTLWNHAAETMFGWQANEAIGIQNPIIPPDKYDEVRQVRQKIIEGQSLVEAETERLHKDGTRIAVSFSATALLNPAGQATGILAIVADITERKRAEEIISSLARFPSENPNPVLRVQHDGTLLYANEASYTLLHELPLEIGKPVAPVFLDVVSKVLKGRIGNTVDIEHDHRILSFTVAPVADGGYANLYGRDITERKQSEGELRESEQRYRSLFENMLEGYAYCHMLYDRDVPCDFIYIDVNQAFENLTGLKNVTGKKVSEVIPGIQESNPELFEIYGRVARTGQPEWFETYLESLRIWFSIAVYSPGTGTFIAIFDNITERKNQEIQLQLLNNRLENLIGVLQQLSSARSLEDVMGAVCTSARAIVGADGATFVLRDGDMCHYADEDAIAPLWKGQRFPMSACISGWVMLNKKSVVIPDIYQDPRIPIDVYRPTFVKALAMVPIRIVDPLGAVGIYWAKRYEASEEELRLVQTLAEAAAIAMQNIQFHNELEGRVKDRTAQLEDANKELEAFSYSVSHDLRAPLRAIDGFSRIVQEDYADRLDAEGNRLLNIVHANTQKMDQLITDLLALSRVTRTGMHYARIDMTTLVHSIYTEIASPDVQQKFTFSVVPLPDAHGDAVLMRQVWSNLLSNAIKYTLPKDERRIEIGGSTENGSNIYYVKDTGVGFDPDYTHKLFGVFQRLHKAEEFEGTGVGLAIVQRIIHRHGGRAWAEGKIDQGATLYFSLPEREIEHG